MKIGDVMTHQIEVTHPETSLHLAARQMRETGVGILPVFGEQRLLGVITDRDIVVRAVALGLDPSKTPVREAMTAQVITVYEDQPLTEARRAMENRAVRRLLVLNRKERLVGLLSLDDLATVEDEHVGEVLERITAPTPPG